MAADVAGHRTPVRMTLTMVIDERDAAEFLVRHGPAAEYAASSPGFLRQTLARREGPADDTVEFVVTSDWTCRTAFRAFETSPTQDRVTAPLAALRRSARMHLADLADPSPASTEGEQT